MKKYRAGGFYWERELYQSDAFLSLNKNSIKVLIALMDARIFEKRGQAKDKKGRPRKPKCINLDSLEMPYGTLEKVYKIPARRIPYAIDELLAKGFIRITYRGGAMKHDKSRYALVNDYLLWRPDSQPFATRPKGVSRGCQGRKTKEKVIKLPNKKNHNGTKRQARGLF